MQNEFILYTLMVWFILYLLHYVRKNTDISTPEFLTHGGISIVALVLMATYPNHKIDHFISVNVVLFAIATIEAIAMYVLDLTKAPLSTSHRATHRIIAALSMALLFAIIFKVI